MKKLTLLGITLGAALLAAAPVSVQWSPAKTLSLSLNTADARVGRPLTPGSVAGVNRRVHRRAYRRGYYGAAVGAAAVGAAAAGAYYYGRPAAGAYYYGRPACGYYPYPPCY
jgi:hypothetical protein